MQLKSLELFGFKSFARKTPLEFAAPVTAIVGPNGSGKSNIAEAFRFVLGEQSIKSLRGKKGEDLIFNGSNTVGRLNRGAVKVVFDNTGRLFNVDFDEVVIERHVHRDGINQYFINGSQVRLKDVSELLASANIGASGHHIISQGEADRILSATARDRRDMIEDSLGLKAYQYKLEESARKLEKAEENMKQTESLRRELAPHIKFLKRQVEKIERARAVKEELRTCLREYLKREEIYIEHTKAAITDRKRVPEREIESVRKELMNAREKLLPMQIDDRSVKLAALSQESVRIRSEKDILMRDLGRIEGQISYAAEAVRHEAERVITSVPVEAIQNAQRDVEELAEEAEMETEAHELKRIIQHIRQVFEGLLAKKHRDRQEVYVPEAQVLEKNMFGIEEEITRLSGQEDELRNKQAEIEEAIARDKALERDAERATYELAAQERKLSADIALIAREEELLRHLQTEFDRELHEGAVLAGRIVMQYREEAIIDGNQPISDEAITSEPRTAQEERRRQIEKLKIRLEENGVVGDEVLKEHEEAHARDQFLERELQDLAASAETLRSIIQSLEATMQERFAEGITKINAQFGTFFALMFGGGEARLHVVKEKRKKRMDDDLGDGPVDDSEEGIEIEISLPRKRIKGLMMLSGGERALTSIALLFAMSQVNPPPFLILDETDAALDEANSKRYGDMIKTLSEHSQLIVITHNRETMYRAGVLYGVTMASDGISKLLSVKFDEAVKVAK